MKYSAWQGLKINVFTNVVQKQNKTPLATVTDTLKVYEPRHEISNNVVCAISKTSDQPAHMRSLIRAFAGRLNIL